MIHVSSGHLKSIGLEVFLKAFTLLSDDQREQFILHINTEDLENYFKESSYKPLSLPKLFQYKKDGSPDSTESLLSALKEIKEQDILLTLPTSKDQLLFNSKVCTGYTNFFREYFKKAPITMVFKSERDYVALLSDHIPLSEVPKLESSFVEKKLEVILKETEKFFFKTHKLSLAGINPHAGENGLLGTEDSKLTQALEGLQKKYPTVEFKGPLPGDTMHFEEDKPGHLKVYSFHDQALSYFKYKNGVLGANITLGLPFLRMSVDHGTAFHLLGKNQANSMGALYVLKEALKVHS